MTDGHIDIEWLRERAGRRAYKLADLLVDAGLWEQNGNGYVIHDYLDYNPSRVEIEAKRAADAARKAERKRT